jgi:hypothetical protein
MTGRNLKFHKRYSLQRRRVSLAFLGSAKNCFCYGLYMSGTDRFGQRCKRRIQSIFHDSDCVWRKTRRLRSLSSDILIVEGAILVARTLPRGKALNARVAPKLNARN